MNDPFGRHIIAKPGRFKAFALSIWVYAAVVAVLLSFVGGVIVGSRQTAAETARVGEVTNKNVPAKFESKDVDMAQFWNIWERIKDQYVHHPVSDPKLFYGSIKGMVASLGDPYSNFFDPDEAAEFARQLAGTFEGIGAEMGFRDSQMIVVAPLPDTPAFKAGLRSGDAVLEIDGVSTAGVPLELAVSKIRGPKGTKVTLTILHDGAQDPVDITIVRDKIIVASVKWNMIDETGKSTDKSGGIALVNVNEFNDDTVSAFEAAVRALMLRDAKGLIIDLRGNPGGYLESAVEVARYWVGSEPVVIQKTFDGTEDVFASKLTAAPLTMPTMILVDGGSASASEILAGALQDYGKATLIGEKTFGKGSVQSYFNEFADGSALKITTALWYTPLKRSIDKTGITPDVEVKYTNEDAEAGKDPQLEKAIELLKAKI